MAITEENIRGKIGNSIFYRVGSVTRVRSVAARYADANTSKQRESRSRLRVAIRFYRRLAETELRKVWYLATKGTGKSGYNLFLKLNMMIFKPDGKIGDFARLQLTVGRCVLMRGMWFLWRGNGRKIFLLREKRISSWLPCFMPIVRFPRS